MRRVLIFSLNYYPRFIGGAEIAIKEITDRIPSDDIEFHVVTLRVDSNLPKEERIGNTIVHRIGPARPDPTIADLKKYPLHLLKHWYQFGAAFAALRLHRKYRFDGIWAMMAHSCGIPAGIFKTFARRVPYLLTLQEGDPPEHIERMMRPVWPLFSRGFTKADMLQPISSFLHAWGLRRGFWGEAEVIPNAVNVAHFSHAHSAEEKRAHRESLGVSKNDFLLVTTSRLVHKNAVDDVIRAVALLPEDVHFVVYGIGPDEDALRALAKTEGVEARVHFKGQIGHDLMPLALQSADAFIRPSRSEGMGNSFVEAMAAGIPVIATQEGGIADFLFDEKKDPDKETTGWAVRKDSPEDIRDAVEDIRTRPDKVARVVPVARTLATTKYDWDLIARDMRALFARLMDPGARVRKLAIATPLYPPEIGGPATFARALERGLPARGWSGVTIRFSAVQRYPKVIRHLVYIAHVFRAARRADLVLALDPVSTGLPALVAARLARSPFYLRVAGDYAWEQGTARYGVTDSLDVFVAKRRYPLRVRALKVVEAFVADAAYRIIVPSRYLARVVHLWDIPRRRIHVAYNAAPVAPAATDAPIEGPYLISVGRLVKWKGMRAVIEAFASLSDTNVSLVIVGDGPERESLEALVREKGIGARVRFTGTLSREDTMRYLAHAKGFILNTRYEGLSHLILEAFVANVPVATTRVGGNPELVEEGKTGLFFTPDDVRGIRECMDELLANKALSAKLVQGAKAHAEPFTMDAMLDAVETALVLPGKS